MATSSTNIEQSASRGNVQGAERVLSALAGVGLLFSALRGRGGMGRIARGAAGLSLLTRGATGYCAVKAAAQGQTPMREGLQQQWTRLSTGVTSGLGSAVQRVRTHDSPQLNSMEALYTAELQELCSAETQLISLTQDLMRVLDNSQLAFRVEEYAVELQTRKKELEQLLGRDSASTKDHLDDAMRALIHETRKMMNIPANNVRDSAIAASIQRIIHYKIAGYGTVAAYAKAMTLTDEAARFAQMASRDKAIDEEITEIAKSILNPEAVNAPQDSTLMAGGAETRTH